MILLFTPLRPWKIIHSISPMQKKYSDSSNTSKPKVLFVSHNLNGGEGAPTSLFELSTGLAQRHGISPIVMSPSDGNLRKRYQNAGIPVVINKEAASMFQFKSNSLDHEAAHSFQNLLTSHNIEALVSNTTLGFQPIEIAKEENVPGLWIIRESDDPKSFIARNLPEQSKKIFHSALSYADHLVFVSKYTKKLWMQRIDRQKPVSIIHNGIDTSRFAGIKNREWLKVRQELGFEENDVVLLNVGTICRRKNQGQILEALALLPDKALERIKMLFIGECYQNYGLSFAIRIKRDERLKRIVRHISHTSEIGRYYSASDAFVFSSLLESYPRVIPEALYFSLPVIANPAFGVLEQTEENVSALYYDPSKTESLASLILQTIDTTTMSRLTRGAKRQFKRITSYDQMLDGYMELLDSIRGQAYTPIETSDIPKKDTQDDEAGAVFPGNTPESIISPRLLFLTPNLDADDESSTSLFELCRGLSAQYNIVTIVMSPCSGSLRKQYKKQNIPTIIDGTLAQMFELETNQCTAQMSDSIKSMITNLSINVVIASTSLSFNVIQIAGDIGIPCIWTIGDNPGSKEYFAGNLPEAARLSFHKALRDADHLVFVSKLMETLWMDKVKRQKPVSIIHYGLEPSICPDDPVFEIAAIRKAICDDTDDILLLNTDEINPRKNQEQILDALKLCPYDVLKNIKMVFTGKMTGKYGKKIANRINTDPFLKDIVRHDTQHIKTEKYLLAADAYVCSSLMESYPRSVLRALSYSMPVISTPVFGVLEQTEENVSALYYDPQKPEMLAEKIQQLSEPSTLPKLREGAVAQYKKLTDYNQMLDGYMTLIRMSMNTSMDIAKQSNNNDTLDNPSDRVNQKKQGRGEGYNNHENIAIAEQAMEKENWGEAVRQWQMVFKEFQSSTPDYAYASLSKAHYKQGNIRQAQNIIRQGLKKYPESKAIMNVYEVLQE